MTAASVCEPAGRVGAWSRMERTATLEEVGLGDARRRADAALTLLCCGIGPQDARREAREAEQAARIATFREVAEVAIARKRGGWKKAKHAKPWRATLEVPADALIGTPPADRIDTENVEHVLAVLQPLWSRTPESRSRQRWACGIARGSTLPPGSGICKRCCRRGGGFAPFVASRRRRGARRRRF